MTIRRDRKKKTKVSVLFEQTDGVDLNGFMLMHRRK